MRRILVGFDEGDEARDALRFGDRLAMLEGATLMVAVAGLFEAQITTQAEEDAAARGRRAVFAAVRDEIGDRKFESAIVEGLPAARGLIARAQEAEADLIVVGSTNRGRIGRVFPGSVGAQLLHGSPCPVAIVPRGFRDTHREVRRVGGVAFDGSPEAELALTQAIHLARLLDVTLRLIAVAPEEEADGPDSRATLDRGLALVPEDVEATGSLLAGDPARTLVAACDELDFMVMGSRGRGPTARTLLGSVSGHVCCDAACPVVVAPRASSQSMERAQAAVAGTESA